jgi:esterase/lipase superfamily enzyme
MSIRYFATNRDRENLGRDRGRKDRILLQEGGYHWVDAKSYMAYYLATTSPSKMTAAVTIENSKGVVFDNFLSKPAIRRIIIGVHGFNVTLQGAVTSFTVLADSLKATSSFKDSLITDPIIKKRSELTNEVTQQLDPRLDDPTNNLTAFVGFSWPSNGHVLDYQSDRTEAVSTAPILANLISRIRVLNPQAKIHIIAHSMGNYLTCNMLRGLVDKSINVNPKYTNETIQRQITRRDQGGDGAFFVDRYIMLAPDVERREVTQCDVDGVPGTPAEYLGPFYGGLYHLVQETHLFYSRFDSALKASVMEKEAREKLEKLKEVLTGPDLQERWENSLGLNPLPPLAPPNMYDHNATNLTNRAIDHGDYFDAIPVAERIAEIILAAG